MPRDKFYIEDLVLLHCLHPRGRGAAPGAHQWVQLLLRALRALGWLRGADPSMVCGDSGDSHLPIHPVTLARVLLEPSTFQGGAKSIPWLSEGRSVCRVSASSTVTFLPSVTATQTVSQRCSQLAANTKTSLERLGTLDSIKKRQSRPRLREQECDPAGQPWLANGSWTKLALSLAFHHCQAVPRSLYSGKCLL